MKVPTLMQSPKALARALKRLNADQGLVARRNARRLVLTTLSRVRRQMDEEYPRIAAKKQPRANDPVAKRRRLEKRGYVPMNTSMAPAMLAAGLRSKPLKTDKGYTVQYVPNWVAAVFQYGDDPATLLRKLKRDPAARKVFMVEHALRRQDDRS